MTNPTAHGRPNGEHVAPGESLGAATFGTPSISILMASYNRRETTLRSLEILFAQKGCPRFSVILVDDRSTDGTAAAVRATFPEVHVVETDGDLYWAGSMALAEERALTRDPQLIIWMNDDVRLDQDAISRLLSTHEQFPSAVIGGAMRDPSSGVTTYGGSVRVSRHPFVFAAVEPCGREQPVDALNGNLLLVPRTVRALVGGIDGAFAHAYADYDYCQRARSIGINVILAAGTFGTCARNAPKEPPATRREALRRLHHPKGLPPRSQVRYLSRHGGIEWPLYLAWPYVKIALGRASVAKSAAR